MNFFEGIWRLTIGGDRIDISIEPVRGYDDIVLITFPTGDQVYGITFTPGSPDLHSLYYTIYFYRYQGNGVLHHYTAKVTSYMNTDPVMRRRLTEIRGNIAVTPDGGAPLRDGDDWTGNRPPGA